MQTGRFLSPTAPALLIAALLACAPAVAQAGEVLVYGPGTPSPESKALATAAYQAATDAEAAPDSGVAHVIDLPFPSQAQVWMAGDLLELPCSDSALADVDANEALKDGVAHIDELDYEKALLVLERAIRALPCTTTPVGREALVKLHFFDGLAEFMMGEQRKAERAFSAARAIDPELGWDKNYPPDAQQVFLDAATALSTKGPALFGIDVRGANLQSFTLDGVDVPIDQPQELRVYPGRHLVRYVTEDGESVAKLVGVSSNGGAAVTREALRESVLNLAWGGVADSAARIALTDLARNRGGDTAVVVKLNDNSGAPVAFRFDVASGETTELSVDGDAMASAQVANQRAQRAATRASGPSNAGRFGLVANGGFMIHGIDPYGHVALRAHIRLIKGLEVGFGVQAGMSQLEADEWDILEEDAFVLLPLILLEGRYRFERGPFHVYLGARGLLGIGQSEYDGEEAEGVGVLGGVAGVVGFDVTPAGDKGFVINLDIAGGYGAGVDEATGGLHLSLGAGLGFRL